MSLKRKLRDINSQANSKISLMLSKRNFNARSMMMNATMETKLADWEKQKMLDVFTAGKSASQVEINCLMRNVDTHNLVAPLRAASALPRSTGKTGRRKEEKLQAALDLQTQWSQLLEERETLKSEIK